MHLVASHCHSELSFAEVINLMCVEAYFFKSSIHSNENDHKNNYGYSHGYQVLYRFQCMSCGSAKMPKFIKAQHFKHGNDLCLYH